MGAGWFSATYKDTFNHRSNLFYNDVCVLRTRTHVDDLDQAMNKIFDDFIHQDENGKDAPYTVESEAKKKEIALTHTLSPTYRSAANWIQKPSRQSQKRTKTSGAG